jgi:hypothetical protein
MSAHHATHTHSREELIEAGSWQVPAIYKTASLVIGILGMLLWLVGAFMGNARAWQAFQFNWMFFTLISSAAVAFVAVQRITTARWSRGIVRLMEGYVAFLPVAWVLLAITLLLGRKKIWSWATVAPAVHEKAVWLDASFLIPRDLVMFGLIVVLSVWYIYTCVRLDVGISPEAGSSWARGLRERMRRGFGEERRELHSTHSIQGKIAVALLIAFAFGWIVLAWDLSMAADEHFQSTMYGWQIFMGGWIAMLMSFAMLLRWWKKHLPVLDLITDHHYHDIGKLCFAFTAFWGYITYGQYLIIWYGNLAEETHWFRLRLMDPWLPLSLMVVFGAFVIPFLGLLSRYWKSFTPMMAFFAFSSLLAHWLHRYLEIYPSIYHASKALPFGLWEIGIMLGFLGIWAFCYLSFMDAFPKVRVMLMTSPYRDEVQIPVDPRTMEPLPAHE